MKHKRLVIAAVIAGLLVAGWALQSNWHLIFPSDQIKALRQLETKLDLPEPAYRYEEDKGYYKDSKGAPHFDRHIALSYTETSVANTLRDRLPKDGWQETHRGPTASGQGENLHFKKGTGDNMQCVSATTYLQDEETPVYITLQASGEYNCNPDPRT